MNCLNQAISEERTHQVRLLLSMDVDGDMKDKNDSDRTPLIKSCLVEHPEPSLKLLKILLKFGVSINTEDKLGRSALHYACATGKSEVAKVLMNEDGIELNNQDNEGRTPLMLACAEGHLVMSRILMGKLVKFDLEIDVRDKQGYTALLLAIKNEHYDVAHDLVRYANAGTTLRDNEKFINAAEWLKSNLEARRKTKFGSQDKKRESKSRKQGTKTPSKSEKGVNEDDATEQHDDVPILTLTESEEQENAYAFDNDSEILPDTVRSAAAMSGLLFEPDQYVSSARSRSTSSGKQSAARRSAGTTRPPSSGRENKTRPWTGVSTVSSTMSPRFSASSRTKQLQKMEELLEESAFAQEATPLTNRTVKNLKKEAGVESIASLAPSRGSRRSNKIDDLESIVEDPDSRQPSRAGGRESVTRILSQQERQANSKTPVSESSKSPYNNQTGRKSKNEKLKEEKSSEIYAIQKLKQALRDKTRRKITRASTAVFRPASGTPSEQWMSEIITGSKRATIASKSTHVPTKTTEPERSPTQERKQSMRSSNSAASYEGSRKTSTMGRSSAMRLLHASSNLSLNTLLSQSDITTSTSEKSKKYKNSNQLNTIFRLYTDSCLWKPPVQKTASLSVQQCDNSEKMTFQSEMSDSVGELLNDFLGSTTGSIPPRVRPESKTGPRNRLTSGSATSRISRASRNTGSAGGRSVASRHAD